MLRPRGRIRARNLAQILPVRPPPSPAGPAGCVLSGAGPGQKHGLGPGHLPPLRHLEEGLGPWPLAARALEVSWAAAAGPACGEDGTGRSWGRLRLREQSPAPACGPRCGCRGGCVPSQVLMAVGRCFQRQPGLWSQHPQFRCEAGTCLGVCATRGHSRSAGQGCRAGPSDTEKPGSRDVEFSPFQSRPAMAGAAGL